MRKRQICVNYCRTSRAFQFARSLHGVRAIVSSALGLLLALPERQSHVGDKLLKT